MFRTLESRRNPSSWSGIHQCGRLMVGCRLPNLSSGAEEALGLCRALAPTPVITLPERMTVLYAGPDWDGVQQMTHPSCARPDAWPSR